MVPKLSVRDTAGDLWEAEVEQVRAGAGAVIHFVHPYGFPVEARVDLQPEECDGAALEATLAAATGRAIPSNR